MKRRVSLTISILVLLVAMLFGIKAFAFELPQNSYWIQPCTCENSSFTLTYSDEGNCSRSGYREYTCINCSGRYYQYVYYEHSYEKYTVSAIAKTSNNSGMGGYSEYKCVNCGAFKPNTYKYIDYPSQYKLSATSYTYDGKAKKPVVTVYDSAGAVIPSTNYKLTYSNNVKYGKATVKITFIGDDYSGEISLSYKIKPIKATLSSLKYNSKGKITATWKKDANATGYIIQYSTSSKFAEKNTCTVFATSNKTVSKAITSLPARTYYVRVAAYKAVGSYKYRGAWSNTRSVKVKSGVTLKQMINSTKTDLSGRTYILNATRKAVDIKKYSTTYDRMKAIYNWHSKNNTKYFANCLECNANFNDCIYALFGTNRQYDTWVWLGAGNFKNRNGSVVMHKWSVLYIKGVPYIFDPRLQGYSSNKTGNDYFGVPTSSSLYKRYLFDYWMFYWSNEAKARIV